jgi:N-acetylglucosaminyldiphosphoundecaprenol N-acetyl-beta-D-mannosaminyltransferase
VQPNVSVLEYDDSQGRQHWRFYVGNVEGLDAVLSDLRFGDAAKGFIAVCNVHMFIVARRDKALASALHSAFFAVCDGQPIAWLAGLVASRPVQRITGPQILHRVLFDGKGPPRVALIGGNRDCLKKIKRILRHQIGRKVMVIDPGIVPPTGIPDEGTLARLRKFAPDIVFVALGCPKQEKWAAAAARLVPSTFIGVGAGINYLTGDLRRAPLIMQTLGLEWLYRLTQQPRLLPRYLTTNLPFIVHLAKTVIGKQLPKNIFTTPTGGV